MCSLWLEKCHATAPVLLTPLQFTSLANDTKWLQSDAAHVTDLKQEWPGDRYVPFFIQEKAETGDVTCVCSAGCSLSEKLRSGSLQQSSLWWSTAFCTLSGRHPIKAAHCILTNVILAVYSNEFWLKFFYQKILNPVSFSSHVSRFSLVCHCHWHGRVCNIRPQKYLSLIDETASKVWICDIAKLSTLSHYMHKYYVIFSSWLCLWAWGEDWRSWNCLCIILMLVIIIKGIRLSTHTSIITSSLETWLL